MDAFFGVRGKFMRNLLVIASFVLMASCSSSGQQSNPSVPAPSVDAQPVPVKVYAVGQGVTAPELLPLDLGPFPTVKCRKKVDGKVVLSLLVDDTGKPRNIMFLHPLGTDLDRFALQIVGADRFNPGIYNGKPVVVVQSVEVGLQTCVQEKKDASGKIALLLRLMSQPAQNFGVLLQPSEEALLTPYDTAGQEFNFIGYSVNDGASPPVLLSSPVAEFSDEARRAKYGGVCLLSLIVDAQGMPQSITVVRKLGMGLDEKAIEAVGQYRFKPAMKNGVPVSVKIAIEINFRLI